MQLSLEDLMRDGLMDTATALTPLATVSRRDILVKLGTRAALLLPVVAAIAALTAAMAYSGSVDGDAQKSALANGNTDIFSTH